MKVILNDHVDNLGDRGATLEVKPGYARNYLFPKGLAYEATPANLARFTGIPAEADQLIAGLFD